MIFVLEQIQETVLAILKSNVLLERESPAEIALRASESAAFVTICHKVNVIHD